MSERVEGLSEIVDSLHGVPKADPGSLPALEEVLLQTPLYDPVLIADGKFMSKLREGIIQLDAYCTGCERETTFRRMLNGGVGQRYASRPALWMMEPGHIRVEVTCLRNATHSYVYLFHFDGERLVKYGQLPSLEDVAGAEIRRYEKVLPKGSFAELKRAGGLASHGIGIGAFVYLRRIFERLIFDHHEALKAEGNGVDGFEGLHMDGKIAALAAVLPAALVENKATYGILSKGLHQLDEDTCRNYFPVVRQAIIAILEQDYRKKKEEEEAAKLKKEIAKIAGEVEGERRA